MTMSEYQRQIERLVDGELPFDEEAKLLETFDEQPAGWKQLAIAFLEDRTFRSAFAPGVCRAMRPSAPAASALEESSPQNTTTRKKRKSKALHISVACALLIAAFVSGRYSTTANDDGNPGRTIADSHLSTGSEEERRGENEFPQEQDELPSPIEFVSLNVGGEGDEVQTIDVPLLPWEQVSEPVHAEPDTPPSLVSEEIKEILARRGQTVRERTDYYPFELSDGRVGVIPVSSVEIQANGLPAIQ